LFLEPDVGLVEEMGFQKSMPKEDILVFTATQKCWPLALDDSENTKQLVFAETTHQQKHRVLTADQRLHASHNCHHLAHQQCESHVLRQFYLANPNRDKSLSFNFTSVP